MPLPINFLVEEVSRRTLTQCAAYNCKELQIRKAHPVK